MIRLLVPLLLIPLLLSGAARAAEQVLNPGASLGDAGADTIYATFVKTKANFDDLYAQMAAKAAIAGTPAAGHVALSPDGGEVTDRGHAFLCDFGAVPLAGKRIFCRPCLDWSERRPHIAGRLGAALASRCLELAWIARQRDSRAVSITAAGAHGFAERFGIHIDG